MGVTGGGDTVWNAERGKNESQRAVGAVESVGGSGECWSTGSGLWDLWLYGGYRVQSVGFADCTGTRIWGAGVQRVDGRDSEL